MWSINPLLGLATPTTRTYGRPFETYALGFLRSPDAQKNKEMRRDLIRSALQSPAKLIKHVPFMLSYTIPEYMVDKTNNTESISIRFLVR